MEVKHLAPIEKIYDKYYMDVYRFVIALSKDPHVAEDVTQETFIKAMKGIEKFKGDCDIRVWLCQIAKNTFYTYAKKHQRENTDFEEVMLSAPSDCDFVKDTIDKEQSIKIHKILHSMSEPYKEVFTLRVFGELSFKDIATIHGKTESWARVTYHRARVLIMNEMEEML